VEPPMAEPASMNNISRTSNFLFMLYVFSFSFRRLRWLAGLRAPQALRLLFLIDPSPAHLSPRPPRPLFSRLLLFPNLSLPLELTLYSSMVSYKVWRNFREHTFRNCLEKRGK